MHRPAERQTQEERIAQVELLEPSRLLRPGRQQVQQHVALDAQVQRLQVPQAQLAEVLSGRARVGVQLKGELSGGAPQRRGGGDGGHHHPLGQPLGEQGLPQGPALALPAHVVAATQQIDGLGRRPLNAPGELPHPGQLFGLEVLNVVLDARFDLRLGAGTGVLRGEAQHVDEEGVPAAEPRDLGAALGRQAAAAHHLLHSLGPQVAKGEHGDGVQQHPQRPLSAPVQGPGGGHVQLHRQVGLVEQGLQHIGDLVHRLIQTRVRVELFLGRGQRRASSANTSRVKGCSLCTSTSSSMREPMGSRASRIRAASPGRLRVFCTARASREAISEVLSVHSQVDVGRHQQLPAGPPSRAAMRSAAKRSRSREPPDAPSSELGSLSTCASSPTACSSEVLPWRRRPRKRRDWRAPAR